VTDIKLLQLTGNWI